MGAVRSRRRRQQRTGRDAASPSGHTWRGRGCALRPGRPLHSGRASPQPGAGSCGGPAGAEQARTRRRACGPLGAARLWGRRPTRRPSRARGSGRSWCFCDPAGARGGLCAPRVSGARRPSRPPRASCGGDGDRETRDARGLPLRPAPAALPRRDGVTGAFRGLAGVSGNGPASVEGTAPHFQRLPLCKLTRTAQP